MRLDLVTRATAGDHDAFAVLATDAYASLYRTARMILRDEEIVADAVQDALLSAWVHIRAVREPERFEAWLRRLLVRSCYRESRRSRRRAVLEVHVESIDFRAPGDMQAGTAVRDQLDRAFERLTVEHRAVLVAHHYLDLPDLDASTMLDIPIGTYKSRLNRASAAMRAALEADERGGRLGQESMA